MPCISQGSGNTFEVLHVGTTLMRTLYFIRNYHLEFSNKQHVSIFVHKNSESAGDMIFDLNCLLIIFF